MSAAVLLGGTATPAHGAPERPIGSARSAATAKICVALVVDARSIGSDVSTACAKVARGATGVAVLQAAGHTLDFRNDGLLCTIDGLPKTGCADVNDTHYWAYYHRAPGSTTWVYSSEGAATYEPVNDSTEGWVYDNGTSLKPDNVPYSAICGSVTATRSATPKPSTPAKPKATPSTTTSSPATATSATSTRTSGSRPATSSPSPVATAQHRNASGGAVARSSVSVDPRPSPGSASATPDPSSSSGRLAGAVTPASGGGHGLVDLIVVLVIVAGLGGFAFVRSRRP